jgi:hypothetical protein
MKKSEKPLHFVILSLINPFLSCQVVFPKPQPFPIVLSDAFLYMLVDFVAGFHLLRHGIGLMVCDSDFSVAENPASVRYGSGHNGKRPAHQRTFLVDLAQVSVAYTRAYAHVQLVQDNGFWFT